MESRIIAEPRLKTMSWLRGRLQWLHPTGRTARRGRKLAQAVKVLALRYARSALGVTSVRTNHNPANLPMIAIDRKLGYVQSAGLFQMVKMIA